MLQELLDDREVRELLQVNLHQGVLWFSQERFDDLVGGRLSVALMLIAADPALDSAEAALEVETRYQVASALREAERFVPATRWRNLSRCSQGRHSAAVEPERVTLDEVATIGA